jgi:ABC-2 type transport system permease protein
VLHDTILVYRRQMRTAMRSPAWAVIGLAQPILYLVFFGPLLRNIAGTPGFPAHANSWQIFVPGLLIQLGLFGTSFGGFSIIADWRGGVIERMRVTPVSRAALLLGRVLRDTVVLLAQAVILVLTAFAFGLRAPVVGIVVGLLLTCAVAVSLASLSYAVGLRVKAEESFAPIVNVFVVPTMLLAGILLPMSVAPRWLDIVSRLTPLRYLVDASRDAFLGQFETAEFLWGVLVAVGLSGLLIFFGVQVFQRENA